MPAPGPVGGGPSPPTPTGAGTIPAGVYFIALMAGVNGGKK